MSKRKFLCLNIHGLKELGTKISELLLFCEIGTARARKKFLHSSRGVFKDYDVYRVRTLEERLRDLESLSLNFWLTKFVQEVADKTGIFL